MTQVRDVLGRARPLAVAVLFVAAAIVPTVSLHFAQAASITSRSLAVTSSVPKDASTSTVAGAAANGNEVGHTYTFSTPTGGAAIPTINFEACTSAFAYVGAGTCSGPSGFDNTLDDSIVTVTGGSGTPAVTAVTKNAANDWTLTVTDLTTVADGTVTVTFAPTETYSFANPNQAYLDADDQGTYFVRVSLINGSSAIVDDGTVTNAVATAIDINTRVQETLKFSVEGDMRDAVAGNNGTPTSGTGTFNGATDASTTCAPLAGKGTILMGDTANNALASNATYDAQSYFRLATNSANGARVYYSGETLTSGSETITPVTTVGGAASAVGTEQFGLTFNATSANTTAASHSFTDLVAGTDYDNAAAWFFTTETANSGAPVLLAQSPGIVSCDTGAVNYIANIAEETAAGIYTTRVVYIASPSY